MTILALVFFSLSVIAAILGFSGLRLIVASAARGAFFVFLVLGVLCVVARLFSVAP